MNFYTIQDVKPSDGKKSRSK